MTSLALKPVNAGGTPDLVRADADQGYGADLIGAK